MLWRCTCRTRLTDITVTSVVGRGVGVGWGGGWRGCTCLTRLTDITVTSVVGRGIGGWGGGGGRAVRAGHGSLTSQSPPWWGGGWGWGGGGWEGCTCPTRLTDITVASVVGRGLGVGVGGGRAVRARHGSLTSQSPPWWGGGWGGGGGWEGCTCPTRLTDITVTSVEGGVGGVGDGVEV